MLTINSTYHAYKIAILMVVVRNSVYISVEVSSSSLDDDSRVHIVLVVA